MTVLLRLNVQYKFFHEMTSKLVRSLFMSKSTPARIILQVRRAKLRDSSAPKWGWPINCIPTIFNANENDMMRSIPVHCCKDTKKRKKKLIRDWNYIGSHGNCGDVVKFRMTCWTFRLFLTKYCTKMFW